MKMNNKMATSEVAVNMCSRLLNVTYGVNDNKKCDECFKMKDHIAMLVSELKSAQLIIKLLQDDAKYECSWVKLT